MPVQDALSAMARGVKDLQIAWLDVRAQWKDEVAERFEEKYIAQWEKDFRTSSGAIDSMGVYLSQVRRDCE
jgi:hypothetical protein